MSLADWTPFLVALTGLVAALGVAAAGIIKALRDNTRATDASTAATKVRIAQNGGIGPPSDDPLEALSHIGELIDAVVEAGKRA